MLHLQKLTFFIPVYQAFHSHLTVNTGEVSHVNIKKVFGSCVFQNSPEVDDEGYSIRPDDDSEGDILAKLTNLSRSKLDLLTCQDTDSSQCHCEDNVCQPPNGVWKNPANRDRNKKQKDESSMHQQEAAEKSSIWNHCFIP